MLRSMPQLPREFNQDASLAAEPIQSVPREAELAALRPVLPTTPGPSDAAVAVVHLSSFSLSPPMVTADIYIRASMALAPALVDAYGQPVPPSVLGVSPPYEHMQFTSTIYGPYAPIVQFQDAYRPGTTSLLFHRELAVGLPSFQSQSRTFPDDSYWFHLAVAIQVPNGLSYKNSSLSSPVSSIPVRVVVSQDADFTDFDVLDYGNGSAKFVSGSGTLDLLVTRTLSSRAFIFVIAGIPFAMTLLLMHLVLIRRLELGALLLLLFTDLFTVLPLRAVLVPQSVGGLTPIDVVLGCEMMILALVGTYAYWMTVWFTRRRTPDVIPWE